MEFMRHAHRGLIHFLMSLVGLGEYADDPSDDIPHDPWCFY